MILYLTHETCDNLSNFPLFLGVRTITDEIESRTGRNNAQFGHFTLFVCKGGQRNLQRVITHVDVGKSYWNPQRKAELGTHFFEI